MVAIEEKLIEKVREHENLYNIYSSSYRDQNMRMKSWAKIAKELKLTAPMAKEMWSKLRNCFSNAIKRRSRQDGKKMNPWKYEMQMAFLVPFLELRTSNGNSSQMPTNETIVETSSEEVESIEIIHDDDNEQPEKKRKVGVGVTEELMQILRDDSLTLKAQLKENSKHDDVELFFLSMARIVKRLPQIEQAKIRLDICRLVTEADIRQAEQQSTTHVSYHNYEHAYAQ